MTLSNCHAEVHIDAPSSSDHLQRFQVATSAQHSGRDIYASATGLPSSYEQVHGTPSRAPVAWTAVKTVAKEELREVLYDVGEQIARVDTLSIHRTFFRYSFSASEHLAQHLL
jgi:hypothetical protein